MTIDTGTPAVSGRSPWLTIWLSPRVTIRRIIDGENRPSWVPVIALAGLHAALASLHPDSPGQTISVSRSIVPLIVRVAQLVFGVLVGPFLLAFVGSRLGGEADPRDIRDGVAWSYVPYASAAAAWIPILMLTVGSGSGQDSTFTSVLPLLTFPLIIVVVMASIWTWVLQVATLAEVQGFSITRAIVCVLIVLIPFVLLGTLT